jgi:hypothetical protein
VRRQAPGGQQKKIEKALGLSIAERDDAFVINAAPTRRTTMNTNTAFRILTANRIARTNAAAEYVVRSITKAGAFSKMAPSQFDYCKTREAAEERVAYLERLNPGRKYGIDER